MLPFHSTRTRYFGVKEPGRVQAHPKPGAEGGQHENNTGQKDSQDDHDKVHVSIVWFMGSKIRDGNA